VLSSYRLRGWSASDENQEILKKVPKYRALNRMVSASGRKDRLRQLEPEGDAPYAYQKPLKPLATAFGLVPLAVPYDDTPPELRVLNAVALGLLFENTSSVAQELGMSKLDLNRVLRSLKNNSAIYVGATGKYRLSFRTSNFPSIVVK
jgi:hypothetical protein